MLRGFFSQYKALVFGILFQPRFFYLPLPEDKTSTPIRVPLTLPQVRKCPELKRFLYRVAITVYLTNICLLLMVGGLLQLCGVQFAWLSCFEFLLAGLVLGGLGGLFFGFHGGLTWGTASGLLMFFVITMISLAKGLPLAPAVAFGAIIGILAGGSIGFSGGLAGGVAVGAALTLTAGVSFGIVGGLNQTYWTWALAISIGTVGCVVGNVTGRLAAVVLGGLAFGLLGSVTFGIVDLLFFLSLIRLPFYLVECLIAVSAFGVWGRFSTQPRWYFQHSPVCFDEMLVLPQPLLARFLYILLKQDLPAGLQDLRRVAANPFQRWAVQQSLRRLLERDWVSFFVVVDQLLRAPQPYNPANQLPEEQRRAEDEHYLTKLLLLELCTGSMPWDSELFARLTTWPLRRNDDSPLAPLAGSYLRLLNQQSTATTELPVFESAREFDHGQEFYEFFRLASLAHGYDRVSRIADAQPEFEWYLNLTQPLRPEIKSVFRLLSQVSSNAKANLLATNNKLQIAALREATALLELVRQATEAVYQPERRILLEVVEHWRQLFIEESLRASEPQRSRRHDNPYVAGRPIRPEDGHLFVGRTQEFAAIEQSVQSGTSIVLHGQRRMGKTSLILHLQDRLPTTFFPLIVNLQSAPSKDTASWLSWLADIISEKLRERQWLNLAAPSVGKFRQEHFGTFHRYLRGIERRLQGHKRKLVLVFDEFEQLETMVEEGRIERDVFKVLRGIMQEFHSFVFVFVGLHTLDQMTKDYWHPLFQSVKSVPVSYLSLDDAWKLINQPVRDFSLRYEKEASDLIMLLTNRHPFLIQDLCFNLVNYLNEPLHRSNVATESDVKAVVERSLESGTYYFGNYLWDTAQPDEQLTLAIIAEEGGNGTEGWVDLTAVAQVLGVERASTALQALQQRGILDVKDVSYRFQIKLSRYWVAKRKSSVRLRLELGMG